MEPPARPALGHNRRPQQVVSGRIADSSTTFPTLAPQFVAVEAASHRRKHMDLRKLKTLIDLVSESNISELEITEAEGKVRIVKAIAPVAASAPMVAYAMPQGAA